MLLQTDWDVYASDFAGPVSLDGDYETVDEIPELLSEEERALLQQLRPRYYCLVGGCSNSQFCTYKDVCTGGL